MGAGVLLVGAKLGTASNSTATLLLDCSAPDSPTVMDTKLKGSVNERMGSAEAPASFLMREEVSMLVALSCAVPYNPTVGSLLTNSVTWEEMK